MSKGMLGMLPLSAVRGPRDAFEEKLAGEDGQMWLDAFKLFLRKQNPWPMANNYAARFTATIEACACDWNSSELTPENFDEEVFGTLGEGYVLAQPPKTEAALKRGRWTDEEVDAWHASAAVAGEGLEAACLVDLAKYGEKNPDEQRTRAIVCWRAGKDGRVAFLVGGGDGRGFRVGRRDDHWYFDCWFLLRKPATPPTGATYAAFFAQAVAAGGFSWWNKERITPENFPGENLKGGNYILKWRALPAKSDGYNRNGIVDVVAEWVRTDATVLGGATAGDGLYFSAEVMAGRRDQPNGLTVCPGSTSVVGELLVLDRGGRLEPRGGRPLQRRQVE